MADMSSSLDTRRMRDPKLLMVKSVLHWAWDPIGVRGVEEARDEYDSYAPNVLELLERSSPEDEVAAYLGWVEVERLGLPHHPDRNADVAALLMELRRLFA
ncbi:hypothetical protein [Novosphingobium sp. AAP83]|uniref:hypothetical protein n=1 Tax=Novosphingobium sp. AAP83 TaxID=1523425 RepID=UPI0018D09FE5|nr:hypothetical protein [Novosphingobium sp. AAP83]